MTTHPYDEIEAFALGALDSNSAERVLEHSDQCATCAILMADAMRVVSALEPPADRPLQLRANVAARLQSRSRPRAYGWAAAAVAMAAAIALLFWNVDLRSSSLPVPIASLVHSHFEHRPLRGAPGAGSAKVIQALDGSWLYFVGDGLQPNARYYLWDVVGGEQREVGSFQSNANGEAAAYWDQAPAKIQGYTVSREPAPPFSRSELHWP